MSGTDNTRPHDVVTSDKRVRQIPRFRELMPLTGGINSENGHGKAKRKESTTSRRQHVRRTLHAALLMVHEPDTIDIQPIRADKRDTGWRYA